MPRAAARETVDSARLPALGDDRVALEQLIAQRDDAVAEALNALPPAQAARVLSALSVERGARLMASTRWRRPEGVIPHLSEDFLVPRLETMDGDTRAWLVRALPAHERARLTSGFSPRVRTHLLHALAAAPDTVGAIASDDFVCLSDRATVAECQRALAGSSARARRRDVVVTAPETGAFLGAVSPARLALASPDEPLGRLVGDTWSLAVDDRVACVTAAALVVTRDADLLAVVDESRCPVGVVTPRNLLRVMARGAPARASELRSRLVIVLGFAIVLLAALLLAPGR